MAEGAGRRARVSEWLRAESRGLLAVWCVLLGLWLWLAVPLALGERTLVARDVFTTHLHLKWFGAEELRAGRVPAFNPNWGLGQPFRGNPNALAFYPGNLLYLVLPFWSAFNLHYMLHWLLAFLAMRSLARALGQGRPAALFAALTYAGSGYVLSAMTYYNIIAVVAWWPLVLWGAVRGGRRGILLAGVACGMALLGGEPMTAALGLVPLLLVAIERRGVLAGVRAALGIGALGLLIALPQAVATWRVLPFTYRFAHGLSSAGAQLSRLPAVRLLELLVPLPFGRPWEVGPAGFVANHWLLRVPYIQSLYCGVVGLLLAVLAVRRHRRWAILAVVGVGGAWLLTLLPGSVERLTGGLARYPEKLLLWYALATPLLAGWGVERVLTVAADLRRPARWLAAGAALAAAALLAGSRPLLSWIAELRPDLPATTPAVQLGLGILSLLGAALLALLAAGAAKRGSAAALLAVQLLALLQLAVLVPTDSTAPYRTAPPFARLLAPGAAVFNGTFLTALGDAKPPYRFRELGVRGTRRAATLDLLPGPGVLFGLRYPLAPDFDGMDSLPVARVLEDFPTMPWPERLRWMQTFGVDAAVLVEAPQTPGLRRLATEDRESVATTLYAVESPAPAAWWPSALITAPPTAEPFLAPAGDASAGRVAVVAAPTPAQDPHGTVRVLAEEPDRIVVETEGGGGVVAITRAYQPLFEASAGERRLDTLPVDFALLGVQVPPGPQHVVIAVSAWPEAVAGICAMLALLSALAVAGRPQSAKLQDPR